QGPTTTKEKMKEQEKNKLKRAATLKSRAAFRTRRCANCARKDTMCVSTSAAMAVIRRSESKCTMASASMLVRASHAKTEWRRGTNHETANGRNGECGDSPTLRFD